jgi:phospholipase/carboxylesterase
MAASFDGHYIDPASGKRPKRLVVLCHGMHAEAGQLLQLARAWRSVLPETAFALPNAPLRRRSHWLSPLLPSRREWFSLNDQSPAALEAGVRQAAEHIGRIIDRELERLSLSPEAYALAGFSQGAMTALFAGLRRVNGPRAIVSFAGSLIAPASLAGEVRTLAPVLLVHGSDDRIVPPASSSAAALMLAAVGVPVATCYRPGLAHEIDQIGMVEGGRFLGESLSRN